MHIGGQFCLSIIAISQGFLLTLFSDCTLGLASNTITWPEQVLGQPLQDFPVKISSLMHKHPNEIWVHRYHRVRLLTI